MTYNYRCSKRRSCGRRKTLKKLIEFYSPQPRCPGCGEHTLKLDPWTGVSTQKRICYCWQTGNGSIEWPHRRGTFLSMEERCEHADVDLDFGVRRYKMKPTDECPF